MRNHYATAFADAVGGGPPPRRRPARARGRRPARSTTRCSAARLPPEVVDAVSATLVAVAQHHLLPARGRACSPPGRAASTTPAAARAPARTSGTTPRRAAYLFPELERSARRTEFLHETRADGRMNFRTNSVFGNAAVGLPPGGRRPARRDRAALPRVALQRRRRRSCASSGRAPSGPSTSRSTEWDCDGDGVLDSKQHNTYDIEFYGAELAGATRCSSPRCAPGPRWPTTLGDAETAPSATATPPTRRSDRMDALLFNGEYYEQTPRRRRRPPLPVRHRAA